VELRVRLSLLIPPTKRQMSSLGRGTEIKLELVEQNLGLRRFLEGGEIVENVL
jgi:hypothetical protein